MFQMFVHDLCLVEKMDCAGISCNKCGYVYSVRFQHINSCRVQWHLDITIVFAELPCNSTSVTNIYHGKFDSPWPPCFWRRVLPICNWECPKRSSSSCAKYIGQQSRLAEELGKNFVAPFPDFVFILDMFFTNRSFCQPYLRNLMSKRSGCYFPNLAQTTRAKLPMKCWKNISVHQLCESTLKAWVWMCQTRGLSSSCWTRMEVQLVHKFAQNKKCPFHIINQQGPLY